MPFTRGKTLGENNVNWKGDNVTRGPMLEWVKRNLGRPPKCDICSSLTAGRYDWISKSGLYRRDLLDYYRICASCHARMRSKPPKELPLCECGCGNKVVWRKAKYIKGHYSKVHPSFLGKKHTKEWVEKTRERTLRLKPWELVYKRDQTREKNPNWNGGTSTPNQLIRASKENSLWRTACFQRDLFTCIKCGSKKNLQVDHIKPFALYPELRFAIDNGRTLCKPCHMKTDTWGFTKKYRKMK